MPPRSRQRLQARPDGVTSKPCTPAPSVGEAGAPRSSYRSPYWHDARSMSFDGETINSAAMPNDEIRAVADWLIDGARSAPQPDQVLAQTCERLVACGIPLWRVAVFVRTLHPNVMGRRLVWRPGVDVEITEAPYELL